MKIRIYNDNGIVKVTKVCENNTEKSIFDKINNQEVAEININIGKYGNLPFLKIRTSNTDSRKGENNE